DVPRGLRPRGLPRAARGRDQGALRAPADAAAARGPRPREPASAGGGPGERAVRPGRPAPGPGLLRLRCAVRGPVVGPGGAPPPPRVDRLSAVAVRADDGLRASVGGTTDADRDLPPGGADARVSSLRLDGGAATAPSVALAPENTSGSVLLDP